MKYEILWELRSCRDSEHIKDIKYRVKYVFDPLT